MKHTIQNTSRHPLTFICNSGKAIHMAPNYSCEVNETDVKTNSMIKKLLDRKLIRCTDSEAESELAKKSEATTKKDKKATGSKPDSKDKSASASKKDKTAAKA